MGRSRFYWLGGLWILLVALDQISKSMVRQLIPLYSSVPVADGVLYFTFIRNTGAVFGSLQNTNSLLIWGTLIAAGLLLYLWDQFPQNRCSVASLMLIMAGTFGNLIDRVFMGYVTDFIDFRVWPVFNLADSMVSVGVAILVIVLLREGIDQKKAQKGQVAVRKKKSKKQHS